MTKPLFRPLAVSLIRKTFLLATVCALCVAAVQAFLAYQQARQHFSLSLEDIARTSVPLLSVSIWDIEPEIVRRQVQAIAERHQIGYVRLEVSTGQVFEAGKLAMRSEEGRVHFDIPYPHQEIGSIGSMDIWPDREVLYVDVVRSILAAVIGYGVLTLMVCATIAVVLRRDLQRPMQHIATFVTQMRPELLTRPLELARPANHPRDEIDLVVSGFHTLQESLNSHIANLDQLVIERTHELNRAMAAIHELSITDPLTGCFNRRYFNERFPQEIERAVRYRRPLSVVFCDIDHFKAINDTYGHAVGDSVLIRLTERLRLELRANVDWLSRYGGEEFVIVLPETALAAALEAAERLRLAIADKAFDAEGRPIDVTASLGVAELAADENAANLLKRADALLYAAKEAGRNCVLPRLPG